jgi:phage-related protein
MADGYLNFDTKINEKGFNDGIKKLGSLGKSGLSVVTKATAGAVAAIGTGAAAIVKTSLDVVANMEQQVGGVETLFKDSASTVIKNANMAYRTAQISANEYMSTVTSFSASLLQGLGGDTAKAAEIANTALIDMADNANKMGTNMRDIQNAYQGFAKQNYTMLDNLKLGYGGTQAEMIRLINDSGVLNEKIEDLDNVTFDQMILAIHKIQENLGITGTSAKEASTTIEGSVNSAKAAWENFEAGVISANDLVDTFWTASQNIFNNLEQIIPRLGKTGMDVLESLSGKIGEAVPQLKVFTDSVGNLADKLQNMSTDELMNLGKTVAVLAGAAPAFSALGKSAGTCGDILSGLGEISGGTVAKLNKMPGDIKKLGGKMKAGAKALSTAKDAVLIPFEGMEEQISGVLGKITYHVKYYGAGIQNQISKLGAPVTNAVSKFTAPIRKLGSVIGGSFGKVGTQISGYASIIGNAFAPILSSVAGFIPSFISLLNFGAVAAVVVAGLGLIYSQFGTQIDQLLLLAQTKGPEIISNLGNGITAALPGLMGQGATLILGLMNAITANLPALISTGASIIATLVSSLAEQLPQLIPAAASMILTLVEAMISNLPQIISSGLDLMMGIANAIPQVTAKAPVIIGKLASTIITNLPKIIQTGIQILTQLAVGLVKGIPTLLGKIPSMISQIKNAFTSVDWGSVGVNIIKGIASGLSSAAKSLADAAANAASNALDWVKSKLGIHSPSRVFRDQVGKMMALGMGIGFEKNIPVKSMSAGVKRAVGSLKKSAELITSRSTSNNSVDGIRNHPVWGGPTDQTDYDRLERIQMKAAKTIAKRPIYLGTERIDKPLPKGAVPQV